MKYNENIYVEYDRKYVADPEIHPHAVESSKLRKATKEEFDLAKENFSKTKKCDHSFIVDEAGWMYDLRSCAICDQSLGGV